MTDNNSTPSVQAVLAGGGKSKRSTGRWLLALLVLALLAGSIWYYFIAKPQSGNKAITYETAEVRNGDLTVSVTATGNLKPKKQVDIGTELSGTVDNVLVEANDVVKKGQELARLNTTQLQDTITRNKATLNSAEAKVTQATASTAQAQATIREAAVKLSRLQQLHESSGGKLPAQGDLDTAEATLERAKAEVASSKAAELAARASVVEARANLNSAQTNLGKAIITSPIDGVVLTRSVEPGQTVAASLSAPTLFTLAEDLAQMEVEVGVDEADVGQVSAGQKAEFTVDAWPGRKYPAEITRVSLGSKVTNNIVTYVTVLAVENADLTLRPGMTATATLHTQSRQAVLLVPNAALRFTPARNAGTGDAAPGNAPSGGLVSQLLPRPPMGQQPRKRSTSNQPVPDAAGMQTVWVLQDNQPIPVKVRTGISDGKMTEVTAGELQAGMQVITDSNSGGKQP